jgi:hypothetical protein
LAPVDPSGVSAKARNTAKALKLVNEADVTIVHSFGTSLKRKMSLAGITTDRINDYGNMARGRRRNRAGSWRRQASATNVGRRGAEEGTPLGNLFRTTASNPSAKQGAALARHS